MKEEICFGVIWTISGVLSVAASDAARGLTDIAA